MIKSDAYVSFQSVQKSYDGETLVIKNLNLETERGEFLTMLGPSGSGKTTCLMMLAGFETSTHGEIIQTPAPGRYIFDGCACRWYINHRHTR